MTDSLSQDSVKHLLRASDGELSMTQDSVITAVNDVMSKEIRAGKLDEAKEHVTKELKGNSIPSKLKTPLMKSDALRSFPITYTILTRRSRSVKKRLTAYSRYRSSRGRYSLRKIS